MGLSFSAGCPRTPGRCARSGAADADQHRHVQPQRPRDRQMKAIADRYGNRPGYRVVAEQRVHQRCRGRRSGGAGRACGPSSIMAGPPVAGRAGAGAGPGCRPAGGGTACPTGAPRPARRLPRVPRRTNSAASKPHSSPTPGSWPPGYRPGHRRVRAQAGPGCVNIRIRQRPISPSGPCRHLCRRPRVRRRRHRLS